MSGLKNFSAITGKKCIEITSCDDEYHIDPTKECKLNIHPRCSSLLGLIFTCIPLILVLHEIEERLEWIDEMDKLGEGYSFSKQVIRNEIAERLRLIKSNDSKVNSNE